MKACGLKNECFKQIPEPPGSKRAQILTLYINRLDFQTHQILPLLPITLLLQVLTQMLSAPLLSYQLKKYSPAYTNIQYYQKQEPDVS